MEKYDKELIKNYTPSAETYELGLLIMEKLGKLNSGMKSTFKDHKMPSKIFAYIESRFSGKIEGIYTTLFDVVNTGIQSNESKMIEPLVNNLLKSGKVNMSDEEILELADIINVGKPQSQRYIAAFGVYETSNKKIIYQPSIDKQTIDRDRKLIMSKSHNDVNIIQMLHTHIWFEKIHPFIDGNGRIGRLILQKSLSKLTNFSKIIPLSWAMFANLGDYYDSFVINNNEDIDQGVRNLLNIILKMYEKTKIFLVQLNAYVDKHLFALLHASRVMTKNIALDILFSLQTKSIDLQRKYKMNDRTIDKIFNAVAEDMDFNRKIVSRNVVYWNIELEMIIERFYS